MSFFNTAYGAAPDERFFCCEGRGFAALEFVGNFGVPQRVAINEVAVYGVRWNRIGVLYIPRDYLCWKISTDGGQ